MKTNCNYEKKKSNQYLSGIYNYEECPYVDILDIEKQVEKICEMARELNRKGASANDSREYKKIDQIRTRHLF